MITERLTELASQINLSRLNQQALNKATIDLAEQIKYHTSIDHDINAITASIDGPHTIEAYLSDSDTLLASGNREEAELVLMGVSILSEQPDAAVAKLAELYESCSEYSRTASFLKQLLGIKGQTSEIAYQLSFALYKTGCPDQALEYLLPYYACEPTLRVARLCGLSLKSLGRYEDAIHVLASTIETYPSDTHSIVALSDVYVEAGMYSKGLDILHMVPEDKVDTSHKLKEAIIHRFMGEIERSIAMLDQIINIDSATPEALWPQCFNYSIAGINYAETLLLRSQEYWKRSAFLSPSMECPSSKPRDAGDKRIRLGLLSSDIGEHVVSRFLTPLLRYYNKDRFHVSLFSPARRFESKSIQIISNVDSATSLEGLTPEDANQCIKNANLDILIDTNGFTSNSGLHIISRRCAPIQCHYIGYHATTGLNTIDYFLGDSITAPVEFQSQYTEKLIQLPSLWMAYDSEVIFPEAITKSKRDNPVLGSFSQITKINSTTLEYWAAAMLASTDTVLAIKDRGVLCDASRKRIESTLQDHGVDPSRVYFFGPVQSHLDHLDAYNAIDIALDTTPWSSATTAFEALGMGVPLVAICGDTTSARMSTSVVSAADMGHFVAHSKEEFAAIIADLSSNYKQLRDEKAALQKRIRSGILFDERRICRDFYTTIEGLAADQLPVNTSTS